MKISIIIVLFLACMSVTPAYTVEDHLQVLNNEGMEPVSFAQNKLATHDLIIFDDALHVALEPFEFYTELITHPGTEIDFVFIEIFSIAAQPYLDAYFEKSEKDETLLLKVFQDDFSGFGYRYETYLDLLAEIWDHNQNRDEDEKIRVIGVDQPVYWEGIHNRRDYELFLRSLSGRDYFLYQIISQYMRRFRDNKKGIFLTNTRHAYKDIRVYDGEIFWNAGTFFHHWHPGKTYSVRIHNATLSIEAVKDHEEAATAEGLEGFSYNWIKMENGVWDEAFRQFGNRPVAIGLQDNVFGNARYAGNLALIADEDQTMYDAYDGLIFLKPLDNLHFTAMTNFFYTPEFKTELKRRIEILQEGNIERFLADNQAASLEEYIEKTFVREPERRNNLLD